MKPSEKGHKILLIIYIIWPLSTLPNLELLLVSNKSLKNLRKQEPFQKYQGQQVLRKENKCMVQIPKVQEKRCLPVYYKNTVIMKQVISTKYMSKILKQHKFEYESHLTHVFIMDKEQK